MKVLGVSVALLVLAAGADRVLAVTFPGPTSSQPLALDASGNVLAVVSPDTDRVSVFDVTADANRRIRRLTVQDEPWGVAILPDASKIYVANTVSGTVSVITRSPRGRYKQPEVHVPVGTEPYALALTPNGTRLYVANARSNDVSVIDTATDAVVATIANVGPEPRGLAITNDGDADDVDETLYVTQFLALPIAGRVAGADDAKAGHVTRISTATGAVLGDIVLNPLADTGFLANGDALARIAPGPSFTFPTGAHPNQLNGIAIRGGFAYVPNTGASPNGPVRFDVNTQSLLSAINLTTNLDAGLTINMQQAVANQTNPARRFVSVPWAIAFEHAAGEGFIVSAASDVVVKITVDSSTGAPAVHNDPADATRVLEIPTGKNPRGIVVNASDTRAYVMNYVSRNVTVIDLTVAPELVLATLKADRVPKGRRLEAMIHLGKELYNTAIGTFDAPVRGAPPISGRMSADGWASCASCHPFGLSDDVVWIFDSGPRRTIPQHTDFDPSDPDRLLQRALGWSAIFDEQVDLELYVRNVSGGQGLLVQADGTTPEPVVAAFDPANTGRQQLKIRRVPAWDALATYVRFGIRAPLSPVSETEPDVLAGRALFTAANCQSCHGGPQWTSSRVRFTPPPAAAMIVNGQIFAELRNVGTFDPVFINEVRANGASPLGANGFTPPSLLSLFAFQPALLHNGAADSLTAVLQNVTHRSAGTGGVDTLTNAADRARIVRFLESIDAATAPVP